jgi:recombinational DNA repair ATPase RecF
MILQNVQIGNFKNILDSGDVKLEADVTCIVGKNESGKTAFLQALHRLNPVQSNVEFNAQRQYPAWLEKQHRRQKKLEEFAPVTAHFLLDDLTWGEIEKRFGKGALKERELKVTRA